MSNAPPIIFLNLHIKNFTLNWSVNRFLLVIGMLIPIYGDSQVSPIGFKIEGIDNAFGLDSIYLISAEETDGRIGYAYTRLNQERFIASCAKYIKDTADIFLGQLGFLGDGNHSEKCFALPWQSGKKLIEIHSVIDTVSTNLIENKQINIEYSYLIKGKEDENPIIGPHNYRDVNLITARIHISITPLIDTDSKIFLQIVGAVSGKIIYDGEFICEHFILKIGTTRPLPIKKNLYLSFNSSNNYVNALLKKIHRCNILREKKTYHLYFALTDSTNVKN